jgi:hypothetical protein
VRLSFSLLLGTIALVGGIAVHMLRRACAGLVTLCQTFVRRSQNCVGVGCSHRGEREPVWQPPEVPVMPDRLRAISTAV